MKTISAADASRHFLKLLDDVRQGETVVVRLSGASLAEISPAPAQNDDEHDREAAWHELIEHLNSRPVLNLGRFDRDELYED